MLTLTRRGPLLVLILTVLLLVALLPGVYAQDDDTPPADTLVIAHQGGAGVRPPNTLIAFEYAVEVGTDMLEMDVHSTSDGVLVVLHDDTVDRTTDGSGAVLDFTYEALQTITAGDMWTPPAEPDMGFDMDTDAEFPFADAELTIPRLEDILAAFPDMPMTIEIKQAEPSIVEPFCALMQQYEMQERVIVASFSEDVMVEFRETCPGFMTSAVESEVRRLTLAALSGNMALFEPDPALVALQVPMRVGDADLVTPEFVAAAHEFGLEVHVWTINDRETMAELVALGVDGIITDFPAVTLEVLGRATLETAPE
jgi:glycerophosphoryl diester phosphodiesterase